MAKRKKTVHRKGPKGIEEVFQEAYSHSDPKAKRTDPYAGWEGTIQREPPNAAPRGSTGKSPPPPGGGPPAGGGWSNRGWDMGRFGPDAVVEETAAEALDIYDTLSKDIPQKRRQEIATERAIDRIQLRYHTGATQEEKKSTRGLSAQKLDTGSVMSTAFGVRVKRKSPTERKVAETKEGPGPKSRSQLKHPHKVGQKLKEIDERSYRASEPKRVINPDLIPKSQKGLSPGQKVPKAKVSNQQFLQSLSSEEASWVQGQMNQPGGLFYGAKGNQVPGSYRRWQRYVNARQANYESPMGPGQTTNKEHPTYQWLKADMRGKTRDVSTNPNRRQKSESDKAVKGQYTKGIVRNEGIKQRDRYKSLAPSHEDFGVGIRVPGIRSSQDIKDQYPDLSDREVFEMRESDKQAVQEFLGNQRMAHETRQSTILGKDKSETGVGDKDRVVFFTTSTGWPAISVAGNSLLGQYVVKKRKRLLYDQRMASRAELKGEFPYAVRDQHITEVATGLSLGAQGRYGAFRHVGYRVGSKKSKGYGKMLPVGSQILRDSSGQPLYDRNGNLRYTEGFTRPFDIRPSNEVGLRVYLG